MLPLFDMEFGINVLNKRLRSILVGKKCFNEIQLLYTILPFKKSCITDIN